MKLHQHMTSTGRQFSFVCVCGWKSEMRYTVEAAGRDVDLHMADPSRNPTERSYPTQRKLCEPQISEDALFNDRGYICRIPDGIPEE